MRLFVIEIEYTDLFGFRCYDRFSVGNRGWMNRRTAAKEAVKAYKELFPWRRNVRIIDEKKSADAI